MFALASGCIQNATRVMGSTIRSESNRLGRQVVSFAFTLVLGNITVFNKKTANIHILLSEYFLILIVCFLYFTNNPNNHYFPQIFYLDHGNPVALQQLYNPRNRFVTNQVESTFKLKLFSSLGKECLVKVATRPSEIVWVSSL